MNHELKQLLKNLSQSKPKCKNFLRNLFIFCNIIAGFIASGTFFVVNYTNKSLSELSPVVPPEFKYYTHPLVILGFSAFILHIFGCHCADIKSKRAFVGFLITASIIFALTLTFIAFLMSFMGETVRLIDENLKSATSYEKMNIEAILQCNGDDCVPALRESIHESYLYIIYISAALLICQLVCKFIGSELLNRLEMEKEMLIPMFVTQPVTIAPIETEAQVKIDPILSNKFVRFN